jgi:hypothetical protein
MAVATTDGPARPLGLATGVRPAEATRTVAVPYDRAAVARLAHAMLAVHDAWLAARAAGTAMTPGLDAALDGVLRAARAQGLRRGPALAFVQSLAPRERFGDAHPAWDAAREHVRRHVLSRVYAGEPDAGPRARAADREEADTVGPVPPPEPPDLPASVPCAAGVRRQPR